MWANIDHFDCFFECFLVHFDSFLVHFVCVWFGIAVARRGKIEIWIYMCGKRDVVDMGIVFVCVEMWRCGWVKNKKVCCVEECVFV